MSNAVAAGDGPGSVPGGTARRGSEQPTPVAYRPEDGVVAAGYAFPVAWLLRQPTQSHRHKSLTAEFLPLPTGLPAIAGPW